MDVNIHLNPERHVIIKEVKCGDFLNIENGAVYTIIVNEVIDNNIVPLIFINRKTGLFSFNLNKGSFFSNVKAYRCEKVDILLVLSKLYISYNMNYNFQTNKLCFLK